MPLHMRLPKLQGFKNRVPDRVPGRQPGRPRRAVPRRRRGRPSTSWSRAGAVRKNQLVKVLGDGDLTASRCPSRAHEVLRHPPRRRSPRPAAGERAIRGSVRDARVGADRAPRAAGPAHRPVDRRCRLRHVRSHTVVPVRAAHGVPPASQEDHCVLTAFGRAFRRPTCARRSSSPWGSWRCTGSAPRHPVARRVLPDRPGAASSRSRRRELSLYWLINLFSGGALLQLSIFALGIMPYITASIIVQLLTVVIPRFEQLKKEGQSGSQADAVHPLPHDRARRSCSPPASSRWPTAASCSRAATRRSSRTSLHLRPRRSSSSR